MKRLKRVSTGVPFVKKDEEIFDGDTVTITSEGQTQEGQFGDQFVIKIKLESGEERAFTVNRTTDNNLIDAFGDDSAKWIGKKVQVFIEKKKINDKRVLIAYLAAPGWERDEFGDFNAPGNQGDIKDDIPVVDIEDGEPIIYPDEK